MNYLNIFWKSVQSYPAVQSNPTLPVLGNILNCRRHTLSTALWWSHSPALRQCRAVPFLWLVQPRPGFPQIWSTSQMVPVLSFTSFRIDLGLLLVPAWPYESIASYSKEVLQLPTVFFCTLQSSSSNVMQYGSNFYIAWIQGLGGI